MTQTNNERELIERLALVDIDLRRSHNGFDFIASLSELEAFAKAYKTASDEKSISQNEQQESVTNLWEALGKWSAYLASNGEQANLAPPSWLIDAVSSATSPHKQSIPDGGYQAATKASEQRIQELEAEIANLHTVMMAAAVEITERWEAHCDEDGCGPANLVRRLENGYPEQYGYDAKTMVRMDKQIDELTESNNKLREAGQALVDRWNTPKWKEAEHTAKFIHALEKAISSTSPQSLAEHDNDVIERIATALENAEGEFKTLPEYVSLVRALKATP